MLTMEVWMAREISERLERAFFPTKTKNSIEQSIMYTDC
jgi:hypothetical protein